MHWDWRPKMAMHYPKVILNTDPIFLRDGTFYRSAGVRTGMCLALSLIEDDHGPTIAKNLARFFVLYKRPGKGKRN